MARRSGLGRGLGALIPPDAPGEAKGSVYREVPTGDVRPNPRQPRRSFDEEALAALTTSVREVGVLQPVLVREAGNGFELIAGERRWRAAKRAGLPTVPVLVRVADDLSSLEQAVVENLHREDLNPLEEAAAYVQLLEDFSLTHEQLARRVGKSRAAITNTLRLFQLPPGIQRLVVEGRLTAGHARALLATPDRAYQEDLAKRAVDEHLSVRSVEEEIRSRAVPGSNGDVAPPASVAGRPGPPSPPTSVQRRGAVPRQPGEPRDAAMVELEGLLGEHFATRVRIEESGGRGRLVVEFGDLDDLERIYRVMVDPGSEA